MELSSSFAYSYTDNTSLVLTSNAIDTENASSIAQDELFQGYSESLLTFASATCIIFILLGVPGNLITIIALARCKKVRNATAVFIINLSLSDLLFCCFNLPLAASTFWRRLWTHGELLCRLFPLMRYGLLAVSLFTVLAITINRYVMIGHPRIYPRIYRRKYLAIMVAATWLCAFGSLIPTWRGVWGTFGLDKSIGSCSILRANGSSPKEFLFIMAFIIPCLSIVLCYARIFYIVRRTAMKSHEPILTSSSVRMIGKSNVQDGNHSERQLLEKSSKEENSENSTSISNSSNCPPQIPSQRQTSSVKIAKSNLNSVPTIIDSSEHVHTTPVQPIIEENVKKEFTLLRTTDSLKSILTNGEDKNLKQTDIDSAFEQSTSSSDNNQIYHIRTLTDSNNKLLGDYIEPSTISSIDLPSSQENAQSGNCLKKSFKESITRFTKQSMGKTSTINTSGTSVLYPGRMTQKDRRLLKMILVIFLSFLICYLPITITKIWRGMTNIHVFNIMGYLLIYFTTCINPIIYVVMSSEYRQAYRNLLLCKNPTKHFYLPQTARLRETRSKAFSQRA